MVPEISNFFQDEHLFVYFFAPGGADVYLYIELLQFKSWEARQDSSGDLSCVRIDYFGKLVNPKSRLKESSYG